MTSRECRIQIKRRPRGSRRITQNEVEKLLHREFVNWFHKRVCTLNTQSNLTMFVFVSLQSNKVELFQIIFDEVTSYSNDLQLLAQVPLIEVVRYTAFDVNGFRFRTHDHEKMMKT